MANLKIEGIDSLLAYTAKLQKGADAIIKESMYEGVKIVADEARKSVEELHTEKGGTVPKYISPIQKDGLRKGLGVSTYRKEDGQWVAVIGFAGYNGMKTKKYPQGQPNALIARSVESGTSYQKKEPFMRKALNRSKARAMAAVEKKALQAIERSK